MRACTRYTKRVASNKQNAWIRFY